MTPARVLLRDDVNHHSLRAVPGEPGAFYQQQHDLEPRLGHLQRSHRRLEPRTGLQSQPHQQRYLLTQPDPLGVPALRETLLCMGQGFDAACAGGRRATPDPPPLLRSLRRPRPRRRRIRPFAGRVQPPAREAPPAFGRPARSVSASSAARTVRPE